MKKSFYWFSLLIVAGALYLVLKPQSITVDSFMVIKEDFDEFFTTDAKIRSKNRQTVYAFATGDLSPFQVKVGDLVKSDQVLTKLEWDRTHLVKAPMKGVISKIYRESGGPINRGEPLFEISGLNDLEVVADLLTTDAVRISVGTPAIISNWGGPGTIQARVTQISRAGAIKTSALGVEEERTEVLMSFEDISEEWRDKLGDNYHVDVRFVISEDKDVITVPLGALFKMQDDWACFVIENKKAKLRRVSVSKRSDQKAVVSSGLNPGEIVIIFPGDRISDGTRVISREPVK